MYYIVNNKLVKIIGYKYDNKTYIVENAFNYNDIETYVYFDLIKYHLTNTLTTEIEEQLIGKNLRNIIM